MSTISFIGSDSMAAAIGGFATKAGHAVEVMSRVVTACTFESHTSGANRRSPIIYQRFVAQGPRFNEYLKFRYPAMRCGRSNGCSSRRELPQ